MSLRRTHNTHPATAQTLNFFFFFFFLFCCFDETRSIELFGGFTSGSRKSSGSVVALRLSSDFGEETKNGLETWWNFPGYKVKKALTSYGYLIQEVDRQSEQTDLMLQMDQMDQTSLRAQFVTVTGLLFRCNKFCMLLYKKTFTYRTHMDSFIYISVQLRKKGWGEVQWRVMHNVQSLGVQEI